MSSHYTGVFIFLTLGLWSLWSSAQVTPSQVLIPEIIDLPNNDILPQQINERYSSEQIGASLVTRLHAIKESDANENAPVFDFWNNSVIEMAFSESYISAIQQNCFLNQHQIDHGRGSAYTRQRVSLEDRLIHAQLGDADEVRPKYAFLALKGDTRFRGTLETNGYHGNIIAVLKDEIKRRATFTPTDSFRGHDIHTFYFRPKWTPRFPANDYWEAQIWGKLCFKDVDHFIVDCFEDISGTDANGNFTGHVSSKGLKELFATGIPTYRCGSPNPSGTGFVEGTKMSLP
jgi:hypothetical protein